jgi:hypothetical protein
MRDNVVIEDQAAYIIQVERCYFCGALSSWLSEDPATYYYELTMVSYDTWVGNDSDTRVTRPACQRCVDSFLSAGARDDRFWPNDTRVLSSVIRRMHEIDSMVDTKGYKNSLLTGTLLAV